jgi:YHS domain-containing protein
MEKVIRPRLSKLAACFDNAHLDDEGQPAKHHCTCRLERTDRFPANVRLELGVSRDGDYETVQVQYALEILPIFFPFKDKDQVTFARNAVNEAQVAAWVEDRLLEFVATYVHLEVAGPYQRENQALDPVCGMWVNKAVAPARLEYQNHTYYFCRDECRKKFAADPERYLGPRPLQA